MAGDNQNEEDFSGSSKFPNTGSRPVTTKPAASGRRPSTNRPMTSMQGRPITSMASRPTTGFVPDWMYKEDGVERPKTGYNKQTVRQEGQDSQERPFSRQSSAVGERPFTSRPMTGRIGSAMGRPGSSATRGVPGTASRLVETAMKNRPASRAGIGLQTAVNVAERPITQQGLTGMKTGGGRGPQRQFQDRSYFLGALRTKMAELTTEIGKLGREVETHSKEQSTYLAYDKRVKELAGELTVSQGQLADYNLLVDKLNTDTDRAEVELECSEVKADNDVAAQEVEQLWAEKQTKEAHIQQLEIELEQERHMADNLVAAMQPELRERYLQLKAANVQYSHGMEEMNQELDVLSSRKATLEDEMAVSAVKREAVMLYDQLAEAEGKRDKLLEEAKQRGTPQQERERLLSQVKEDNAEISIMERHILEASERMRALVEEREQLDQDLEENQSERNQKYRELKKREETMDQFLNTFDETKDQEIQRLQELEEQIATLLEAMSQNLSAVGHLPSSQVYSNMKEDLAFKEGEVEKSKNTLEGLNREHQQLTLNLEKIEALEEKIKTEMTTLKEKMTNMDEEMVTFSDLDKLRQDAEAKRTKLQVEQDELKGRREGVIQNMQDSQLAFDSAKKALNDNETYIQLTNLERKWQVVEQNNFAISEFINNKRAESNFEPIKNRVMKLQWEYNKMLQESLKKS